MDDDMEYSDRISDFLHSKLMEIKLENERLENSFRHRQEIEKKCQEENENIDFFEVKTTWKRVINGKYILGFELKNNSPNDVHKIGVTLTWSSSSLLTYKFLLVSNSSPIQFLTSIPSFESGLLLIIIDFPLFTDSFPYIVFGSISFTFSHKKIFFKLPSSIQLLPQDTTDNSIIVHLYKVIDGNLEDFLALTSSIEKYEFVVVIPNNSRRLIKSILEVDCSFHKINFATSEKYFLIYKITPELDGSVLEIGDEDLGQAVHINLYCKNMNVVVALLHYLHRHIAGVAIIPKGMFQPDLSQDEITELFRKSLSSELHELKRICKKDCKGAEDSILDLEYATDVLMSRIVQKSE